MCTKSTCCVGIYANMEHDIATYAALASAMEVIAQQIKSPGRVPGKVPLG